LLVSTGFAHCAIEAVAGPQKEDEDAESKVEGRALEGADQVDGRREHREWRHQDVQPKPRPEGRRG